MDKMKTFKTKIDCGKIDWNKTGRKINAAEVEVEYRLEVKYIDGKPTLYWEFSAMGAIWNNLHTDWISGGQCLDKMARYFRAPQFREVYDLWKKYHLNGMTAGSPAQEAAKKDFKVDPDVFTWSWYDKTDMNENTDSFGHHVTDDESTAKAAEAAGHYVERNCGDYHDQLAIFLARRGLYSDHSFIYEGKPYKYGHAWLVTEIPEADKERIRALVGITKADEEAAEAEAQKKLDEEGEAA